jgi:hypothetical protein
MRPSRVRSWSCSEWSSEADASADNILFSLPYDEERYKLTLEVCALVSDLEILEDGDEAEIGERGVRVVFCQSSDSALNNDSSACRSIFLAGRRREVRVAISLLANFDLTHSQSRLLGPFVSATSLRRARIL